MKSSPDKFQFNPRKHRPAYLANQLHKITNFSNFNDREPVYLLCIDMDALLKKDMQRVGKVQYKTLQLVYNNYMARNDDVLALDGRSNIHQMHLQFLK